MTNTEEYGYQCCTCKCCLILEEDRIFEVGEVAKNRLIFCEFCFNNTVGENTISLAKNDESAAKRDKKMLDMDMNTGTYGSIFMCGDKEGKNFAIRIFSSGNFYYRDRLVCHGKDVYVLLMNAMKKLGAI